MDESSLDELDTMEEEKSSVPVEEQSIGGGENPCEMSTLYEAREHANQV